MQATSFSYSLSQIDQLAAQLWTLGADYPVWVIEGEMGFGKTTLVAALCKQQGVQDSVSSPTYSIINEYVLPEGQAKTRIFHSDWYRLRDASEAQEAGVEDILYQDDAFAFVEWAARAPELLQRPILLLSITWESEQDRKITISEQAKYIP